MPSFDNIPDLTKWLLKQIKDTAKNEVADAGRKQMRLSIDKKVYQNPKEVADGTGLGQSFPQMYERTYELMDSVSSTHLDSSYGGMQGIQIDVFNDTDKINPYRDKAPKNWNQHASQLKKLNYKDVSEFIPLWTAYGHGGIFHMPERDYFADAEEELLKNQAHIKALRKGLKARGITFEDDYLRYRAMGLKRREDYLRKKGYIL